MDEPRVEAVCQGEPQEMGLAQGTALRAQIAGARQTLRKLDAFRSRQPWWLPYPVFRFLAERKAGKLLGAALSRYAPAAAQGLGGIAEGSGLPFNALALLNAFEALLGSLEDCTAAPPLGACSAAVVRGARSATGDPILAKNFDYLPAIQPYYVLRESRPRGQRRSLDFTVAPLCGTVDGINELGLAITYNYAFTVDGGAAAPTISMAIAEALASCGTVAEAAERMATRPRWGSGLLMLADAAGDLASLELSNTRAHLRRPEGAEDVLFHTNCFFSDEMREVELAPHAVFTRDAPAALTGQRVLESPEVRRDRLASLLRDPGRLGQDELAALMADHGLTGQPDQNTLCMHGSYWATTACLQLLPRSRRMRIAYEPACRATYREFGL